MNVLFDYQTILPHPVEDVFARTVDLEHAPRWHSFFTNVQQLTPDLIGLGSQWELSYGMGSFTLEITDYHPTSRVSFEGSPVWGTSPNFTIELQPVPEGTQVHYILHPDMPALLSPLMAIFAPPYGRRYLNRYFAELDTALTRK